MSSFLKITLRLLIISAIVLIYTIFPQSTVLRAQDSTDCAVHAGGYGVIAHLSWAFFYTPDQIDQALDMMVDAGINRVRLNWSWKDIEPEQGEFHWERFDLVAQKATDHNIELLPILLAVPPWSSTAPDELKAEYGNLAPVDRYRPAEMDDWLNYVQLAVERYDADGVDDAEDSPRIGFWEVWNEPNVNSFWPPAVDVPEYADLLQATYTTIKATDPTATVVLGGLSGPGIDAHGDGFIPRLYELGAGDYFDVVSVHMYIHPTQGDLADLQTSLEATRAILNIYDNEDKPIWLTEIGWSDAENAWGQPTASEGEIAAFLTALFHTELPVDAIFWYNFRNIFGRSPEVEHHFGLLNTDFSPKPAFEAYTAVIEDCG